MNPITKAEDTTRLLIHGTLNSSQTRTFLWDLAYLTLFSISMALLGYLAARRHFHQNRHVKTNIYQRDRAFGGVKKFFSRTQCEANCTLRTNPGAISVHTRNPRISTHTDIETHSTNNARYYTYAPISPSIGTSRLSRLSLGKILIDDISHTLKRSTYQVVASISEVSVYVKLDHSFYDREFQLGF